MPQITVLVGGMAEAVALQGVSFAPCMGRVPNAALGAGADLLGLLIPVGVPAALAEFVYAADIVLHPADHISRGVAVHEYGHVVMCDLLATQGAAAFQVAWTDVILATSDQTADNEASYLAEAFADFFAAQVVGGTNYFSPGYDQYEESKNMNYCLGGRRCLEQNYHELDHSDLTGGNKPFRAQVRRVATLLHDAFDGRSGVGDPNDGSHWHFSSFTLIPDWGHDSDRMDESIMLPGAALRLLFDYWHARGAYLREETFLGGLADMARAYGYPQPAICDLFELHSSTSACPMYAGGSSPVEGVVVKDQIFGVSDSAVVSPTGSGTTAPSVRAPLGGSVLSQ